MGYRGYFNTLWNNRFALLIGGGRFGEAALNLVQIRLYSEILSVAQVGRLSLLLTVLGFVPQMLVAPTGSFVQRQAVEWRLEGRLWAEIAAFELFLLSLLPVAAFAFWAAEGLQVEPFSFPQLLVLGFATILLFGSHQNLPSVLNILGHRGWFVAISNVGLCLGIVIAVGLSHLWPIAEVWQTGMLAGYGLLVPVSLWLVHLYSRDVIPYPIVVPAASFWSHQALEYCLPLFVTALCFWLQTYGYRLAMAARVDAATIGIFTLGFTLGTLPMVLITKIANDYLVPAFYRKIAHSGEGKRAKAWSEFALHYMACGFLTAPVVAAGAHFYCRFMLAPAYWDYSWLEWLGAATQLLAMVYSAYVLLAQGMMNNRSIVAANIVAGILVLILTLALSSHLPLLGPGFALLMGGGVLLAMAIFSLHGRFKISVPIRPLLLAGALGIGSAVPAMLAQVLLPSPSLLAAFLVLLLIGIILLLSFWIFLRRYPLAP